MSYIHYIPNGVLQKILTRLPAEALLKYRCVCDSWKSLIDSHSFIQDHLNLSRKRTSDLKLIIKRYHLYAKDFALLDDQTDFQELFHPLKNVDVETEILGSCDGWVVLSNGKEINILWNPSTRKFKYIPVTPMEFPDHQKLYLAYGFGYDRVKNDYKILRIAQIESLLESNVKVFSVKSNLWKKIPDFEYFLWARKGNGVLVNGALHWIVGTAPEIDSFCFDNMIASFDLETEEYHVIALPKPRNTIHKTTLAELGENLTAVYDNFGWNLDEYGVEASWSLLFTLKYFDEWYEFFDLCIPIAFSLCGKKVLVSLDHRVFMWYHLDNGSIDLPPIQKLCKDGCLELHTCVKSLLLLDTDISDLKIETP